MARIFIEGFESGDLGLWDAVGASVEISTVDGNNCAYLASGHTMTKYLPSKAYLYVAFKCYPVYSSAVTRTVCKFYNGATVLGALSLEATTHKLIAYKGDSATSLATSTAALPGGRYDLIEIYYLPHATDGAFQVKLNGNLEIDIDPADGDVSTSPSTLNIDGISFGQASTYLAYYFDDIVIDDAAWIGNTRITAIAPTGAGATTGWTPSAGANYTAVDDIPSSDADYVSTNTENAIDTYVMGNPTSSVGSIKCVAVQSVNWRAGNGAVGMVKHVVRPASTDRVGATVNGGTYIPISATGFQTIWETNPEDAGAWEIADVEGMEAGIKAVTA